MVKFKITKTEFDALSDEAKKFYIENASRKGEYIVDLDPDHNKELTTALDNVRTEKADLKAKLDAATAELTTERGKNLDKNGAVSKADHDAMVASWQDRFTKETEKLTGIVGKKDDFIKKSLLDGQAAALAAKISTVPSLMAKAIKDRLTVDMTGDEPKLVVLDKDGRPSAFTVEDLRTELVANPEYASIVIGSKASGGSAHTPAPGGSAPDGGKTPTLSQASPDQLLQHMKATSPAFQQS